MTKRPPIYGLLAEFDGPEPLVTAAERAHQEGYRKMDAYSPFPVEGLAEAIGFHQRRLPTLVLLGGLAGGLGGFLLQYFATVIYYPIDIGGKPLNSWPAFIPVTFEMTILGGALMAVLGMLALNGLPMPYHPLFNVKEFDKVTGDGFFLCIEATDPSFGGEKTKEFLKTLGAQTVNEVDH